MCSELPKISVGVPETEHKFGADSFCCRTHLFGSELRVDTMVFHRKHLKMFVLSFTYRQVFLNVNFRVISVAKSTSRNDSQNHGQMQM